LNEPKDERNDPGLITFVSLKKQQLLLALFLLKLDVLINIKKKERKREKKISCLLLFLYFSVRFFSL
jgi:hypothetical protein